MTPEQLEHLTQRLLEDKSELETLEETAELAAQPVQLDQSAVGRLSRMDAIQMQQMARESALRRKKRLVDIESALRLIEIGNYGYCRTCGEEINIRRLEFAPASQFCIDCAE